MCRQQEDDDIVKCRYLLDQGLASEAIQYFGKLRERRPQSARVHLHSAYIYDRMDKERKAIPLFEQALRLGRKKVDARVDLLDSRIPCCAEEASWIRLT